MRISLAIALLLVSACCEAQTVPLGESTADRGKLEDLYASQAAWEAEAATVQTEAAEFARCKGHLGDSAVRLRECLDLRADYAKRFSRMWVYASEQFAYDTGAAASAQLVQRIRLMSGKLDEATAFVDPELLGIGRAKIDAFIAAEPGLRIHRQPLARTLRAAPHTLDEAGETMIAQFDPMSGSARSTYRTLTNADMPWPKLTLSTGDVALDQSAYTRYRANANRAERQRVMTAFFGTFKGFERTIGGLLNAQLQEDAVYARVQKYPDTITRALDQYRIPVAVIDTLIAQTNANLPTLHRYLRLRARMLGITDLRYHDLYPPLVTNGPSFTLAQAKQLTLEAVAPLGRDYVDAMAAGFDSRWMDAYPRPRKESGAHMAGSAYDVHPYVLMGFNGDYESVTTLAHEWGHAMHSSLANRAQPFVTANYPTFIAEIASTFNEEMLVNRMLKTAKSDDERLFYLGSALEGMRQTFFRQEMFAEFERGIHARVDAGEPLTGEALTKTYCELLKRHHGAAEGVMTIDDAYCVEWAYIPHFYTPFYVYQYATSIAASALFAQQVERGDAGAVERYLGLLKAGGSDDPYDLVKTAGVDLATPAPYQAMVARMNDIMDRIEAILAKRP